VYISDVAVSDVAVSDVAVSDVAVSDVAVSDAEFPGKNPTPGGGGEIRQKMAQKMALGGGKVFQKSSHFN